MMHECDWPGCGRAYKRADHLERHQRIHVGDLKYRCHHCDRHYSRSDVLSRHLQHFHAEKGISSGRPRRSACVSCISAHVACDGTAPRACQRCVNRTSICRYEHWERESSMASANGNEVEPSGVADDLQGEQCSAPPFDMPPSGPGQLEVGQTNNFDLFNFQLPTIEDTAQNASTSVHGIGAMHGDMDTMDLSPTSWLTQLLHTATANPTLPLVTPNALIDNNAFDWGFSDFTQNIFEPIATRPPSPVAGAEEQPPEAADDELVVAVSAEEVDGRPHAKELPDGRPPESPWTAGPASTTPEEAVLIRLPSTHDHAQTTNHVSLPGRTSVNPSARRVMQILTLRAHQAIWPTPDLGNFPSEQDLTTCVDLYLAHFAAWLPIIDSPRGTFRIDKAAPIVLKAVAAIGSVYARDGLEKLGMPLAELVRRDILFISEHDDRLVSELAVVQALLLQTYFAVFAGSPKLQQQAEPNRIRLVSACKRLHLLRSDISAAKHVLGRGGAAEEMERALKQDHRRRRLGWSIFLLDAQLALYFSLPAQSIFTEVQTPLPTVEPESRENSHPFADIMSAALDGKPLPSDLDDVGYSCLAHALYRLALDVAMIRTFTSAGTDACPYPCHPLDALADLSKTTLALRPAPSALLISCTALSYHAHLQCANPGVYERIKLAAGKSGSLRDRQEAATYLQTWMLREPEACRRLFANAAALKCLCVRHIYDTPPEVIWLFDSAIVLWACLEFGAPCFAGMSTHTPVVLSWTWIRAIDSWIEHGLGGLTIQGVGNLEQLSSRDLLQSSANSLDLMSWGLAGKYKEVLVGLAGQNT